MQRSWLFNLSPSLTAVGTNHPPLVFLIQRIRTVDATHELDTAKEVLTLKPTKPLSAGTEPILNIKYTGIINDKMAGFYRSSYKDKETGAPK